MELEDMKKLWQEHDNLLKENKMLNEKLISTMLKDKSKSAISSMINYEYLGASVCAVLVLVYLMLINTAFENTLMTVSYFMSLLFIVTSLALCFYKIKMLNSVDLASGSVTGNAKTMELFRLFITKERLASLVLSPVLIFTLVVVFARWVKHENIFDFTASYISRIVLGSIIAVIAMVILYSRLYFRNIKQITDNLEEIEKFSN